MALSATFHSLPLAKRPQDRRAVSFAPAPGTPVVEQPRHVAVVGGGIAGLAAAAALAERGVSVVLYEAQPQAGGRVRSWPLADGRNMSRGFHAFFRQYYNLRALLRRADPDLDRLTPIADYPLTTAGGLTDSFARIPRATPWNLIGFVLRSPSFPLRALPKVNIKAALELIQAGFPATFERYTGESAAEFLDRLRFPHEARHLALEVFARSFFANPRDFSAAELVAMFHTYFTGSGEGLLFDVPDDDYDTALWAPLVSYLTSLGVEVRLADPVQRITVLDEHSSQWQVASVSHPDGELYDAVVLAADPRIARKFIADLDTPALQSGRGANWSQAVARQQNAPAFGVLRIWYDGEVAADRPAFLGTSGYGSLDNISVLERFETSARMWADQHEGSVVELHAYALTTSDPQKVRADLLAQLHRVYPETAELGVVAEDLRIDDDCALITPEQWSARPGVATPLRGLVLAGDWVRCDLPVALMERAATTGFLAANRLLKSWGVTGHEVHSPPLRGILRRRGRK